MRLLSSASANTKTRKSQEGRPEYRIVSLMLSPDKSAPGFPTNCPASTPSCVDSCVGGEHVGLSSIFKSIALARQAKTAFLRTDRAGFLKQLVSEIQKELEAAENEGTQLAVRLNCFSDLPWEMPSFGSIPEKFPGVCFWDYTKVYSRIGNTSPNYHLTASWTELERHQDACADVIERGHNVAVIFGSPGTGYTGPRAYSQQLPKTFAIDGKRRIVLDGDVQDMRFLDKQAGLGNSARYGFIVGLRLKSANNLMRQRALNSGFAVSVE